MNFDVLQRVAGGRPEADDCGDDAEDRAWGEVERLASSSLQSSMRDLAHCFTALADQRVFERLGRYEAALCRQVIRTLFALKSVRGRFSPALANR